MISERWVTVLAGVLTLLFLRSRVIFIYSGILAGVLVFSPLAFRSCSLAVIIVYYGLLYMSIGTLYKVYRMFLVDFIL